MRAKAFTLMELIIVTVIIGIIAGFAFPGYQKAMARQKVKRLLLTTNLIAGAMEIYKARNGHYWCDYNGPDCSDLSNINTGLGINIIPESGVTYGVAGAMDAAQIIITDSLFFIFAFKNPGDSLNILCSNSTGMKVCP